MNRPNGLDRQGADIGDICGQLLDRGSGSTAARSASPDTPLASQPRLQTDDNPFRRLYALGYRSLVPLIPVGALVSSCSSLALRIGRADAKDPRGKAPGMLADDGRWIGFPAWTKDVDATPEDCRRWHAMGADVGLRMGGAARLLGIDCDTTSAELGTQVWWIAHRHFPGTHAKRTGRAPKWAIILRVTGTERVPFRFIEFEGKDGKPERVEGLSTGKQLKVWGLHPVTGLPYTWEPDVPAYDDLVEATPEQIAAFFGELERTLPGANRVRVEGTGEVRSLASLRGDADMIEAAVRRLPNKTKHFPTREDFVSIGYAIKGAIADERRAFACFVEWSDRWLDDPEGEGNVDGYAEAVWRTLHPRQKGAGWLLNKIEEVTGEPVASHWFGPLETAPTSVWDAAPGTPSPASGRRPFELTDFVDVASLALAEVGEPLIEGLLDCASFVVLYGPSGSGKTFAALDLAWHIAMGLTWNGKRVRRMRVVYIAAEGAAGARKRSEALRRRFGLQDEAVRGWFLYRTAPIDLLRPNADLGPAIEAIAAVPDVGLVVIDTMSRALAGGDENSPVDMGGYVRNLDRLRAATSACVLNVHHTGKDLARGARGHSLLRAATDTELEVIDGTLTATKQREIETNFSIGFALDVVRLGVDARDRTVTSCVVRWETSHAASDLTEKEALVLAALRAVAVQNLAGNARPENITGHLAGLKIIMKPDAARQHLKNLVKKNHAVASGKSRWAPKTGNSNFPPAAVPKNLSTVFVEPTGEELEIDIFA